MAVISIDLGTTGCKAAVFDGARILGAAYRHFDYVSREEGRAEQDANAVWVLVNNVVKQALVSSPQLPVIDAVGVSVQGDAIIPIDSKGNALHPAILGMDSRSYKEAAILHIDQTIEPADAGVSAYEAAYERFRQVYAALKSLYHDWRTVCPNTPDVSNE